MLKKIIVLLVMIAVVVGAIFVATVVEDHVNMLGSTISNLQEETISLNSGLNQVFSRSYFHAYL